MADTINLFLINAPAGSGKTTYIKTLIRKFSISSPNDNILCITYTNRAAIELSKDIMSSHLFIGTIHSFLHNFIKQYFAHKEVIELYFSKYGGLIEERILNLNNKDQVTESNNKYKEKYGDLSFDIVKKNIKVLYYNETPYNSLYYGGLSHDDLIEFSKCMLDKFPIIKRRLKSKYQAIFIDEYQDTTSSVLNFFALCNQTKVLIFPVYPEEN